jgi:hypothetical protein
MMMETRLQGLEAAHKTQMAELAEMARLAERADLLNLDGSAAQSKGVDLMRHLENLETEIEVERARAGASC